MIKEAIGRSDHMSLKISFKNSLKELVVRKSLQANMGRPKKDAAVIYKGFETLLRQGGGVNALGSWINGLKVKYKPRIKKFKNFFKPNRIIDEYAATRRGSSENNFCFIKLRKMIISLNNEEFSRFMEFFEENKGRATKEYFRRLRFYSKIGKKVDILKNIELDNGEIITDPSQIDNLVTTKYKKLFKDNGYKSVYPNGKCITITTEDVDYSLNRVSLDKAVSNDYFPGACFKELLETKAKNPSDYKFLCERLAELLNGLLKEQVMNQDIITARLICLNKNGEENGKLDAIRPIAVASILIKLIEAVLLRDISQKVYSEGLIHKNQIGFRPKCGTDLNLMRLRVKIAEIKKINKGHIKHCLFIDFKAAYDLVNHKKLFAKLRKMRFSEEIVSTIEKLYSNSKLKVGPLSDLINVNSGVLQGSLISPILFNLYINDLIDELSKVAYLTMGFADDILTLTASEEELDRVCSHLERWSLENDMVINYSKSGLFCLTNKLKATHRNNYPYVENYKYLGVYLDKYANPKKQVDAISKRIEAYLSRNHKLLFKYFSPRSLMKIHHYFHKSRLTYGMSSFLDIETTMKDLEKKVMKMVSGILKMPHGTSHARIRASLGIIRTKHKMACMAIKNLVKYELMFAEKLTYYNEAVVSCMDAQTATKYLKEETFLGNFDAEHYITAIERVSMELDCAEIGVESSNIYRIAVKDEIYNTYDRRHIFILKYFTNSAYFKARFGASCQYCGEELCTREHITNICPRFISARETALKLIASANRMGEWETLSEVFNHNYFNPSTLRATRNKMIKIMSVFMTTIMTTPRT